jgi:D-alanine-D-alanine ligase
MENIDKTKYEVMAIGITREGKWLYFEGPTCAMRDGSWEFDPKNRQAFLSPDATIGGIVFTDGAVCPVDVVFPVLHGLYGEDGTVQGLLELARIPYVGCHVAASAVAMDKVLCKMICEQAKVPQARWIYFLRHEIKKDLAGCIKKTQEQFAYPVFVKPANAGSSVGITKAHDQEELQEALLTAARHDEKIVIEESIRGREIECAVLGNEEPIASLCGEIFPGKEFYDYDAKYADAGSKTQVPADLEEEVHAALRRRAIEVYKTLNCKGLARVDFFLADGDRIIFNEINTIPGFTSISMYPTMIQATGISYGRLVDELIDFAIQSGGGAGC